MLNLNEKISSTLGLFHTVDLVDFVFQVSNVQGLVWLLGK